MLDLFLLKFDLSRAECASRCVLIEILTSKENQLQPKYYLLNTEQLSTIIINNND